VREDTKLQEFMQTVNKSPSMPSHISSYFAKYPLHALRHRNVLLRIEIQGKKLDSVLKHASFAFTDDGDMGFTV
jgi:hypothetical protein